MAKLANKECLILHDLINLELLSTGFTAPSTKQYKADLYSNMSVQFSAVAVHSYKFSTKQNSFCILNFLQCSTVQHQG